MDARFLKHLQAPPPRVAETVASYQNGMERVLRDMARLPGWRSWRQSRILPVSLLHSFTKAMRLYDESTRFFLGYLRRCGYNVSCEVGCSHCCMQMPCGVGAMELIFLYHGMWECGDFSKTVRRFLERQQCWSKLCGRLGGAHGDESSPKLKLVELLTAYERQQQACPLLEDGLCRVYRYRPFACRMHFSLSPPHWCRPDHFQHGYAVCFSLEPGKKVYEALSKVDERFGLDPLEPMMKAVLDLTVNVLGFQRIEWSC
jgi:hypothetical protein